MGYGWPARNANNGATMSAGPLMQKFGEFKLRVLAKLGVPGYQPYERLGLWLRRELRDLVLRILLDPQCLDHWPAHSNIKLHILMVHGLCMYTLKRIGAIITRH